MQRTTLILIATALLVCSAGPARAASASPAPGTPASSRIGLGIGTLQGRTLYHITFYDLTGSGGESELEFPLDTVLIGIEGSYRDRDRHERDAIAFDYRLFTNLGAGRGKMKDSDWLTDDLDILQVGAPHPGLDIYSESTAELRAWLVDLRLSSTAWTGERWDVGLLGGLLYQRFSYDVRDLAQVGYGPYAPSATRSVAGPVLTYEVTYIIPFLGVRTGLAADGPVQAELDLGFSPLTFADDEDDHLLRGKRAVGRTQGTAFLATLAVDWKVGEADTIRFVGQHLRTRTDGDQTQQWYRDEVTVMGTIPAGTKISGIDDRIDASQTSVHVAYQRRF